MDEAVYAGLHQHIGRRNISRFLSDLARPYVVDADIETGYRMMAEDREREAEAMEWAEALIGDVLHG